MKKQSQQTTEISLLIGNEKAENTFIAKTQGRADEFNSLNGTNFQLVSESAFGKSLVPDALDELASAFGDFIIGCKE